MERPINTVFNPCGHCFCAQCSELSSCPKCLQDVAGKTKVFGPAQTLADMLCRQSQKQGEGEGETASLRLTTSEPSLRQARLGGSSTDSHSPAKRGGAKCAQHSSRWEHGAAVSQSLAHGPRSYKRVRVKHGSDAWVRALDAEEGGWGSHSHNDMCRMPLQKDATDVIGVGQSWKAGDHVEALYRKGTCSGWFPAVIACLNADGTLLLNWDDGDCKDRHKTAKQVRQRS